MPKRTARSLELAAASERYKFRVRLRGVSARNRHLHPCDVPHRFLRRKDIPDSHGSVDSAEGAEDEFHARRSAVESEENEWWSILEVLPDAKADEIRRSYLRKIQQSHPDRLVGLTPEFLELAEKRTKTLNAAYTEAKRARRSSEWIP